MSAPRYKVIDVCPLLARGEEPLALILAEVAALALRSDRSRPVNLRREATP